MPVSGMSKPSSYSLLSLARRVSTMVRPFDVAGHDAGQRKVLVLLAVAAPGQNKDLVGGGDPADHCLRPADYDAVRPHFLDVDVRIQIGLLRGPHAPVPFGVREPARDHEAFFLRLEDPLLQIFPGILCRIPCPCRRSRSTARSGRSSRRTAPRCRCP